MRLLARCSAAAQRQRTLIILALAALTLLVITLPDLRPVGSTTLALAAALLLALVLVVNVIDALRVAGLFGALSLPG